MNTATPSQTSAAAAPPLAPLADPATEPELHPNDRFTFFAAGYLMAREGSAAFEDFMPTIRTFGTRALCLYIAGASSWRYAMLRAGLHALFDPAQTDDLIAMINSLIKCRLLPRLSLPSEEGPDEPHRLMFGKERQD